MIKYKLRCKKCKLLFDSWFASSLEYEKLKKKNFLNCHNCNSKKVEKSLMAPKMISSSEININDRKNLDFKKINKKIKEYQKFIKKNFDYVGENFSFEARSIHYNNKKRKRGIYGTASKQEIKELKDEGIKTETIPWIDDKKN
mgnify:CR=1 FL=1